MWENIPKYTKLEWVDTPEDTMDSPRDCKILPFLMKKKKILRRLMIVPGIVNIYDAS